MLTLRKREVHDEPQVYALARLVQTREDRGSSIEQLAEFLGLTPAQVASFEAGEHPLGFIDVRNWLLALDMPFVQFTREMEEVLDITLTTDEGIAYPDEEDEPDKYARAAPLASSEPAKVPTIQLAKHGFAAFGHELFGVRSSHRKGTQ